MLSDTHVYLDYATRTPLRREALDRMLPYLTCHFGTPGASHKLSRKAQAEIEKATKALAYAICALPSEVHLASGRTEANNVALQGLARCYDPQHSGHIITSCTEHESVLSACRVLESQGHKVTYLEEVSIESVESALRPETFLVSLSLVNSQTGRLRPLQKIAATLAGTDILVHSDAAQAANLGLDVRQLGIHALTLSSDQVYGPQGAALLWLRKGCEVDIVPVTENLAAVVGFAQALALLAEEGTDVVRRLEGLRAELCTRLDLDYSEESHPGIVSVPCDNAEEIAEALDLWGFCVASTQSGLRFSFGRHTSTSDIEGVVEAFSACIRQLENKQRLAA